MRENDKEACGITQKKQGLYGVIASRPKGGAAISILIDLDCRVAMLLAMTREGRA